MSRLLPAEMHHDIFQFLSLKDSLIILAVSTTLSRCTSPALVNMRNFNQQIAELQNQIQELQNQIQELRYEYARLACITGVIIICLLAYIFQDYLSKYI
uniref:F-box domain-containing protein n=1 Tax=Ditylenchus dipsaci TaxID=166011 RepID=A0A915E9X8_9BILA